MARKRRWGVRPATPEERKAFLAWLEARFAEQGNRRIYALPPRGLLLEHQYDRADRLLPDLPNES